MLLPHNGKAFGATREIYGTLQGKTSPLASFLDSKVEYDDDGRVAGGGERGWLQGSFGKIGTFTFITTAQARTHTNRDTTSISSERIFFNADAEILLKLNWQFFPTCPRCDVH